jgi:hypothetical protein
MSDRVSQTIVICEDEAHQRLTKAYLKRCGLPADPPMVKWLVANREQQGGNDAWVLSRFPKELHACRQRSKRAKTLLVVLIDADSNTVENRRRQLLERAKSEGIDEWGSNEPVVLLIPKRHIETWIRVLLGETVTEEEDCKSWKPTDKDDYRRAAQTVFDWSRPNATAGPSCVPSLRGALPEWKKID